MQPSCLLTTAFEKIAWCSTVPPPCASSSARRLWGGRRPLRIPSPLELSARAPWCDKGWRFVFYGDSWDKEDDEVSLARAIVRRTRRARTRRLPHLRTRAPARPDLLPSHPHACRRHVTSPARSPSIPSHRLPRAACLLCAGTSSARSVSRRRRWRSAGARRTSRATGCSTG